ncbi:MAG: hypothetical protein M0Q41_00010 [Bacteroidales bacterium]|nr:hypothetical protein [Bacteroidales bacterium]
MNTKTETLLEIDFQDFFKEDTVSFNIEGCNVFSNLVLTSDEILGMTEISVQVIKETSRTILIKYQENEERRSFKADKSIQISVILNGKENVFEIDPTKGKYIGFGKKIDEIYMLQSQQPFEYE